VSLAGFTNLTQDHLDYHSDFEDYFASKMRLFDTLLPKGGSAVVDVDTQWGARVAARAEELGLEVFTVGWAGRDLQLKEITPHPASQDIELVYQGEAHSITLPLIGEFQAANALMATGLAIRSGVAPGAALESLKHLTGVPGRLEQAGKTRQGSPVLIDYAHTPDGLEKLLRAARPHTQGRIVLVFGAGGDRDPTKRAKMGEVARKLADLSIVTDDNPRSEDPAKIRKAILEACPGAREIGDRGEAIYTAVSLLDAGDTLLIAGKGHETGQTVGDEVIAFDDGETARQALARREGAHECTAMDRRSCRKCHGRTLGRRRVDSNRRLHRQPVAGRRRSFRGADGGTGRTSVCPCCHEGWRGGRSGIQGRCLRRPAPGRRRCDGGVEQAGNRKPGPVGRTSHRGDRLGRQDQREGVDRGQPARGGPGPLEREELQ